MYLQLMRDTTGHDLRLYIGDKNVFTSKSFSPVFYNEFKTLSYLQRWQFVPDNGTLIINPAERRDSGTYRVEIHDSTGRRVGVHTVQLIIEGKSLQLISEPLRSLTIFGSDVRGGGYKLKYNSTHEDIFVLKLLLSSSRCV